MPSPILNTMDAQYVHYIRLPIARNLRLLVPLSHGSEPLSDYNPYILLPIARNLRLLLSLSNGSEPLSDYNIGT